MPSERPPSTAFVFFLIVTAIVCGALVMVIEVLGSRVLGPFFGVSLFVWTSLITVTLVALAVGYAVGGFLSDRKSSPDYLYGIILIAGFFVLLIPLAKGFVLKSCMSLGLRSGSLASAALLFGPSLFLLGCVSPYLVRIAAREMRNIGRTVGIFYSISTVGSFVGTLLTGFILIAYFRVDRIFDFVGCSLVVLAVLYFVFFRKKRHLLVALLVPVLLLSLHPGPGKRQKVLPNETTVREVYATDSFYGNLRVLDYSYRDVHLREMVIDGLIQGGIDVRSGQSIHAFSYFMEFLPFGMQPSGKRCLVIGLGAGIIPMWYEARGIKTDVVDIDPKVVEIARQYFGFRISGDVFIADARYHLITSARKYDYVIVDVFTGDTTPGHVLSLEALRLVKERMTDSGILSLNLIGSLRKESYMTASVLKTLREVFRTVRVYPLFSPAEGEGLGNLAVIASDNPSLSFKPEVVRDFAIHPYASAVVTQFIGKEFIFPAETPAMVLSDEHNPIDVYDVWLKEEVRRIILRDTDWDMLI